MILTYSLKPSILLSELAAWNFVPKHVYSYSPPYKYRLLDPRYFTRQKISTVVSQPRIGPHDLRSNYMPQPLHCMWCIYMVYCSDGHGGKPLLWRNHRLPPLHWHRRSHVWPGGGVTLLSLVQEGRDSKAPCVIHWVWCSSWSVRRTVVDALATY